MSNAGRWYVLHDPDTEHMDALASEREDNQKRIAAMTTKEEAQIAAHDFYIATLDADETMALLINCVGVLDVGDVTQALLLGLRDFELPAVAGALSDAADRQRIEQRHKMQARALQR